MYQLVSQCDQTKLPWHFISTLPCTAVHRRTYVRVWCFFTARVLLLTDRQTDWLTLWVTECDSVLAWNAMRQRQHTQWFMQPMNAMQPEIYDTHFSTKNVINLLKCNWNKISKILKIKWTEIINIGEHFDVSLRCWQSAVVFLRRSNRFPSNLN